MIALNPKEFGKVGVLMGGRSAEREISLMSGNGVLGALLSRNIDAHAFDTGMNDLSALAAQKFDRVFITLHGRYGEDGTMQGVLEHLGIPYTGSSVLASALAMDKEMTKRVWMNEGLSTPRFHMLKSDSNWDAIAHDLCLPVIVKPSREGSTIGLTKVTNVSQLCKAYENAAAFDTNVLAEEFIDGDELTVPVLGVGTEGASAARSLPIIRILAPDGDYSYQNKYFKDDTRYECPPPLSMCLQEEVQRLVLQAYRVLGCRGWGRIDLMLRKRDNKPYLLEMNTSPGMTGHSLVPMSARAVGLSYEDLVLEILSTATLDLYMNTLGKLQ
ncbi:D-alanine--D-alanine ligase [Candidatus Pandoraea novymonadis]|uniref:D-alanine--D-alanine ligase n=1 Tax=Candidatus Pandoraea novymonadis TaxID=1808959 RepID=A0ABX5FFA3_9BURK|nr:D-alanine--D-alanine ligase [Candidatus Pandoraea novymonadis]PSB92393.1 D-alanine--D-alanine ligase B [Candidatus Pandoraea novymonadis]